MMSISLSICLGDPTLNSYLATRQVNSIVQPKKRKRLDVIETSATKDQNLSSDIISKPKKRRICVDQAIILQQL